MGQQDARAAAQKADIWECDALFAVAARSFNQFSSAHGKSLDVLIKHFSTTSTLSKGQQQALQRNARLDKLSGDMPRSLSEMERVQLNMLESFAVVWPGEDTADTDFEALQKYAAAQVAGAGGWLAKAMETADFDS